MTFFYFTSWCELSNLQDLDLSENGFNGMFPSCLEDLTSIRILDLFFNQFTGNLTSSPLSNLPTLEVLSLSYNHFEIPVSFISFSNHSKLKIPKFQLKVLNLANCGSNNLGMKFSHFLFYQYDLRMVDLSHNSVRTFPVWLLENNTQLEVFHLINCSLTGPFLLPSYPNPHANSIDISDNHLAGPIPANIGSIFPNLFYLKTSRNLIQGHIPTSLDPKTFDNGCPFLFFLKLSNNNLSGQISFSFVNLARLVCLYLDNNHFTGKFSDSMSFPSSLVVLGISNNHVSGKLPRWMGNMYRLIGIAMFSNHYEGPIPVEFCELGSLEFLDLLENNLSGSIPPCFNQLTVKNVHLNRNQLSGPMTCVFYNSSSLVTLDLSNNHLNGTIHSWIGNLLVLSILLLKFNNFEGEIPVQLCQLKQLSLLDLSENNFFGPIPLCFCEIPFEITHEKSSLETIYRMLFSTSEWELLSSLIEWSKSLGDHSTVDVAYGSISFHSLDVQQKVEFTTKHASYTYKGYILDYMSRVDLSYNHLTGEIPLEMGNLSNIHVLNLSHNNLFGSIASTFSQLKLNGKIPSQLIELDMLEVFSVHTTTYQVQPQTEKLSSQLLKKVAMREIPISVDFPCQPTALKLYQHQQCQKAWKERLKMVVS
ncbi:hypothetical protein ACSBR1_004173 [Camellia fascicularis]